MHIDFHEWNALVENPNGLWYASDIFWPIIERLFVNPTDNLSGDDLALQRLVIEFFKSRLFEGKVVLGNFEEYFNDDDRWMPGKGWIKPITVAVIHHSAQPEMTYHDFNVWGLLRLYAPLYKNSAAFKNNGQLLPISSGHLYEGMPTFLGDHWIVDDEATQYLQDEYVGFHAGHYSTNVQSVGICLNGDYTDALPSPRQIDLINAVLAQYPTLTSIIGHNEVPGRERTICPGNRWHEWKHLLKLAS